MCAHGLAAAPKPQLGQLGELVLGPEPRLALKRGAGLRAERENAHPVALAEHGHLVGTHVKTATANSASATTVGYTTSESAEPTPEPPILMLINGRHIRIIQAHTGELIRDLTLNPAIDYQPQGLRKPRPKPN